MESVCSALFYAADPICTLFWPRDITVWTTKRCCFVKFLWLKFPVIPVPVLFLSEQPMPQWPSDWPVVTLLSEELHLPLANLVSEVLDVCMLVLQAGGSAPRECMPVTLPVICRHAQRTGFWSVWCFTRTSQGMSLWQGTSSWKVVNCVSFSTRLLCEFSSKVQTLHCGSYLHFMLPENTVGSQGTQGTFHLPCWQHFGQRKAAAVPSVYRRCSSCLERTAALLGLPAPQHRSHHRVFLRHSMLTLILL